MTPTESESIEIILEVTATTRNPAMLMGMDLAVTLHWKRSSRGIV